MDNDSIEKYVKKYRPMVYRLAYSMVRRCEDAEDISQDVFVRLCRFRGEFDSEEGARAWLCRVAINLAKDMLKSANRRCTAELTEDIPAKTAEDTGLLEAIQRLSPEDTAVLYLFYYEGYSVKDIARIRRSTSAAIRTRLSRARERLRKMLTEEDYI